MRTLCDVCDSAAAILFCAADEAALCSDCDHKLSSAEIVVLPLSFSVPLPLRQTLLIDSIERDNVGKALEIHMCNKLASRHVRVGLADPTDVPRCDICENAPAFFYCEIDGSSLCLQCDMIVHVGGKRTHERYLLLRQRVEFPGDKPAQMEELGPQPLDQNESRKDGSHSLKLKSRDYQQNHSVSPVPRQENSTNVLCLYFTQFNVRCLSFTKDQVTNACLRYKWGNVGNAFSSSPSSKQLPISSGLTRRLQLQI
ncbi:hypothetical protein RJT34_31840 [Clitoria ternatea]|uniref:B box-type domain-containing protein n=1 Tax=Clitoria ternatea TaxID=43366 RepID=A0AAN9I3Y3_CLITE